jgi:hypothetical protein
VVRAAFKKYTEDLAAAKKKVEADVLQSIKEEMPSGLYDAYMPKQQKPRQKEASSSFKGCGVW